MLQEPDSHPMTVDEFSIAMRGFYDLLEQTTETLNWIAEDMYRERTGEGTRTRPPHIPWQAE